MGDDTRDPNNSLYFAIEAFEKFSKFVEEKRKVMPNVTLDRLHMAVGISGEAGELIDAIKKEWVYNKPSDTLNIREELGDLLFYIQGMCNIEKCTIPQLLGENIRKLTKRYPNKYSDKDAQERKDKL